MKIYTSYFYQIRNFKPNMIPVSTALSDPAWYRPPAGQQYYIDKRGIICGLRYEPLIVQNQGKLICFGLDQCIYKPSLKTQCPVMDEYRRLLYSYVDKGRTLRAFEFCANKFAPLFDGEEPIIVLMVHEAPGNFCSERESLQSFFHCEELRYPI